MACARDPGRPHPDLAGPLVPWRCGLPRDGERVHGSLREVCAAYGRGGPAHRRARALLGRPEREAHADPLGYAGHVHDNQLWRPLSPVLCHDRRLDHAEHHDERLHSHEHRLLALHPHEIQGGDRAAGRRRRQRLSARGRFGQPLGDRDDADGRLRVLQLGLHHDGNLPGAGRLPRWRHRLVRPRQRHCTFPLRVHQPDVVAGYPLRLPQLLRRLHRQGRSLTAATLQGLLHGLDLDRAGDDLLP
mmetsp:Transcript_49275/g.140997  ORF Transcript_49275/g.140997 Transcript_49275/m.140997 type:complete len:245 (+) Transcript_49275:1040-1774(+)